MKNPDDSAAFIDRRTRRAVEAGDMADRPRIAMEAPETSPDHHAQLRAIVADDDPFVRRLVKEALQASGIVVIAEAASGREAVELTLHYRPDAVLMDIV